MTQQQKSKSGRSLRDLMNRNLVSLDAASSATEGAREMRKNDVGNVLVTRDGKLCGIVTDRDLVVRCVAEGKSTDETKLGEFCTEDPITLEPDADVRDAIRQMTDRAVRRVPIVENDKPVGIVSLGDLAMALDDSSVLGAISAANPTR